MNLFVPISSTRLAVAMLALAALIAFVRLLRGPALVDRVIAIDLLGVLIVGLTVVSAAATGEQAFLDVAIVIALISFVGTVAYARYVERSDQS
jgi:multicomponent Na+:H+ antiporter subunit F